MKNFKLLFIVMLGVLGSNFAHASFDCVTFLNNYYALNSDFERYDDPNHKKVHYKRPSYAKYRFSDNKCDSDSKDMFGKCKNKVYLTKINTNF